ncbi:MULTISPECIES: HpcH/HpaI aldolase family protein [unclassified Pseudoclavibacter]|uniref:HpcH/HpaI aldolase family protein n=1 Tax=unclassified Pseudoclavibacter TaxID=2615177 RepID=UPI00130111D3|nr:MULTISPECIES: aldolase/citrate lyase family protein [unclassified Pseudoclavibacter]KAB1657396.1 aldolase [Pseudoclavibacter sp. CFCC 11306]KAB1660731.1 aldolase [Pseudoclavibacter sp. CFCC 13796]
MNDNATLQRRQAQVAALRGAEPSFGLWNAVTPTVALELAARQHFDYVCVDWQHGLIDYADVIQSLIVIDAAGSTPIVRVPGNNANDIGKALDAGASAIIVPLINTADEARAAVRATRYPVSGGARSYGPMRAEHLLGADPRTVDKTVALFVMIETQQGLDNLDAIVSVDGVDGVYIGPYDLSLGLGAQVPFEPAILPKLEASVEHIRSTVTQAGKIAGIHTPNGEAAAKRAQQGFNVITVTTDVSLLAEAAAEQLAIARQRED